MLVALANLGRCASVAFLIVLYTSLGFTMSRILGLRGCGVSHLVLSIFFGVGVSFLFTSSTVSPVFCFFLLYCFTGFAFGLLVFTVWIYGTWLDWHCKARAA